MQPIAVGADLFGFIEERLRGTEDIRSNGAQNYILRRLFMLTRKRFQIGRRARFLSSIPWSLPILFFTVSYVIAFIWIAWLYRNGTFSIGMAFLIYYYTQQISQPIQMISSQLDDFQKASAGILRVRELMSTQNQLHDGPGESLPAGPLSVEFEQVNFGYGDEELMLHEISFHLEPGEVLGLLGRTGSGKTTITRLLFRLYDPNTGTIRLGDVNIKLAHLSDLRRHIGIVTQDVQLFHASVRDNLTLFDQSIEDTRILQALQDLELTDWYDKLADGLDTILAANGGGLLAGEAQLLAFTRVFLRDPGLIILNEASSRLDPITERLIEHAVDKLLHGRTGIIIAHRLGTVQRADTILIMDAGQIREYGTRTDLIAFTIFAAVSLIIMLQINIAITLAVFLPLAAITTIVNTAGAQIKKRRGGNRQATGDVTGFLSELFGAVQAIQVANAEEQAIEHFRQLNHKHLEMTIRDRIFDQVLQAFFANTVSLGTGMILLLAGQSMHTGSFTIGDFALFVYYLGWITEFITMFGGLLTKYRQAGVSIERLLTLLNGAPALDLIQPDPVYAKGPFPEIPAILDIQESRLQYLETKDLTYHYPKSAHGITKINLRLQRGSFTVVTGRIGAGKTTLLQTILGLLPKEQGGHLLE